MKLEDLDKLDTSEIEVTGWAFVRDREGKWSRLTRGEFKKLLDGEELFL